MYFFLFLQFHNLFYISIYLSLSPKFLLSFSSWCTLSHIYSLFSSISLFSFLFSLSLFPFPPKLYIFFSLSLLFLISFSSLSIHTDFHSLSSSFPTLSISFICYSPNFLSCSLSHISFPSNLPHSVILTHCFYYYLITTLPSFIFLITDPVLNSFFAKPVASTFLLFTEQIYADSPDLRP